MVSVPGRAHSPLRVFPEHPLQYGEYAVTVATNTSGEASGSGSTLGGTSHEQRRSSRLPSHRETPRPSLVLMQVAAHAPSAMPSECMSIADTTTTYTTTTAPTTRPAVGQRLRVSTTRPRTGAQTSHEPREASVAERTLAPFAHLADHRDEKVGLLGMALLPANSREDGGSVEEVNARDRVVVSGHGAPCLAGCSA